MDIGEPPIHREATVVPIHRPPGYPDIVPSNWACSYLLFLHAPIWVYFHPHALPIILALRYAATRLPQVCTLQSTHKMAVFTACIWQLLPGLQIGIRIHLFHSDPARGYDLRYRDPWT